MPQLELWLPDIQSYLSKVISPILLKEDFHFNKADYSFHRKYRKSSVEIGFVFVSQFPVNYRVSFSLQIWHPKISKIKLGFLKSILQKQSNLSSISLFMQDFTRLEDGEKGAKDFTIYDHKDLFIAGEEMTQLIQNEVIPLCGAMESISKLDEFYSAHPDWSVNTLGGSNICTDLIAARLNKKRDYRFVYETLKEQIRQKIQLKAMSSESMQLLSLCYDAL